MGLLAARQWKRSWMAEQPGTLALLRVLGRSLLIVFMAVQGGVVANPGAAMGIASAKTSMTFVQAFSRGILCNWLVCMAGTITGRVRLKGGVRLQGGANPILQCVLALLCLTTPRKGGGVGAMREASVAIVSCNSCSTEGFNDRKAMRHGDAVASR